MQTYLFKILFLSLYLFTPLFGAIGMPNYFVTPTATISGICEFADPCTFQKALSIAQTDGYNNTIYVSAGIYDLSGAELYFDIAEDYALNIEGSGSELTILDAGFTDRLLDITSSAGAANATITIRNLTFTKGSNDSGNGNAININTIASPVIIENCRFIENGSNDGLGGAGYIYSEFGDIQVNNNILRNNHGDAGGGFYLYSFYGTTTVLNNEFSNNSVSSVSEHNGGGLYAMTYSGALLIANNIFSENTAIENGGGLYTKILEVGDASIINNTLINNSADLKGGGIYASMVLDDTSITHIYNNIVWDNYSRTNNGHDIYIDNQGNSIGALCYLSSNLFGGDTADYYSSVPARMNSTFNIHANPLLSGFVALSDARRSLRLIKGSSAIDAGNSCVSGIQMTDYEGGPRIVDTDINLGAVETVINPILVPIYYLLLH